MRFDDMATTVIARADIGDETRAIAWQQLVDLAAQRRSEGNDDSVVYPTLRAWRDVVDVQRRRSTAKALAGRPIPSALFAFFAEDDVSVVRELAGSIQFSDETWCALLPSLPVPVRALLRHREDLSGATQRALATFGRSDRLISPPENYGREPMADAENSPSTPVSEFKGRIDKGEQIRDLMSRIETFRRDRPPPRRESPLQNVSMPPENAQGADVPAEQNSVTISVEQFRFETAPDGVVLWVEGVPREPLIGITIATPADIACHGVDGQAAGAFRRRAPFRDAILIVPGSGIAAGDWRISAVPFFDPNDGRFMGYRGTARRPRNEEKARSAATEGLYGSAFRAESLRQLVHELRTPLNAILGFAEMIEGQILGPAARNYRDRAVDIISDARKLLDVVDDLDTAARVDGDALRLQHVRMNGSAVLQRIVDDLEPLCRNRGVEVKLSLCPDLPEISVDPEALERMFSRLLSPVVAVCAHGEDLGVRLESASDTRIRLVVKRPDALAKEKDRDLLDPGYALQGDWPDAPVLGLGFALRLVRNLAEAVDGTFSISPSHFELLLPVAVERLIRDERA